MHGVYHHLADDPALKTHFSLKNAADAAGYYNDLAFASFSERYPAVRCNRKAQVLDSSLLINLF